MASGHLWPESATFLPLGGCIVGPSKRRVFDFRFEFVAVLNYKGMSERVRGIQMKSGMAITLAISAACWVASASYLPAASGKGHRGGAAIPGVAAGGLAHGHDRPDSGSQFKPGVPLAQPPTDRGPGDFQRRDTNVSPTPRPKKSPRKQKTPPDRPGEANHGNTHKHADGARERREDDSGRSRPDLRPAQSPNLGEAPRGTPSPSSSASTPAVPFASSPVAEGPHNRSGTNVRREASQRLDSLSEDERVKLKAALAKAIVDPEVRTVRDRLHQARRDFRKVIRPALIKADPSVQPILEKVRAERDPTTPTGDD